MSGLNHFLFSTSAVVAALLVAGLWQWGRPRSIAARRFLVTAAIFYGLASTYVVPQAIGRLLSAGYNRFEGGDVPPGLTAVVVLGAGSETTVGWDERPFSILNAVGASRVLETWRVVRLIDPVWVVSSGGVPDPGDPSEPSGVIMRDTLVRLGVPADRIRVEARSRDTHDEAVLIAPMLRSLRIANVVLVTSDIHMRRSLGAFRAQGVRAIPAIAPDPRAALPRFEQWHPTLHGLSLSAEITHELLGIPYYRVRGWWQRP